MVGNRVLGRELNLADLQLKLANIVLIYDSLATAHIAHESLLVESTMGQAQYAELPGIIVVQYPDVRAEIIVLNEANRVEIKQADPAEGVGEVLSVLAVQVSRSITNANLTHYGFNFIGILETGEDARVYLLNQLGAPIHKMGAQLEASVSSAALQLNYRKADLMYQLDVRPDIHTGSSIRMSLTVHFDGTLPDAAQLQAQHEQQMSEYFRTVEQLFGEFAGA